MSEGSWAVDVALVHYPVVNRAGEVTASAITNLDLHDIARAGCTYGVGTFWVITPDERQQELAGQLVSHWTTGYGSKVNPDRRKALSLVRVCSSLEEVLDGVDEKWQARAKIFATSAKQPGPVVSYAAAGEILAEGEPLLLLFGTASGLAPEVFQRVDGILPPLQGRGEFNHLSVRSAVSITLDRVYAASRACEVPGRTDEDYT